MGVNVINVDTSAPVDNSILNGFKPDVIIDNWSKNNENASFVINLAKESNSQQIMFVSSAGMYKSNLLTPVVETDAVKSSDVRAVEVAVAASGIPYTFFRPQYIYGTKSNKRYLYIPNKMFFYYFTLISNNL